MDFLCLACGTRGCPYESGCPSCPNNEFDPVEEQLKKEAAGRKLLPYPKLEQSLRAVVAGAVGSSSLWASHKFVGDAGTSVEIKQWARGQLGSPGLVNSPNWGPLRMAVKEALRHRRQDCIDRIRAAFFGEHFLAKP